MRGLLTIGLIVGLLILTTAVAGGGPDTPGPLQSQAAVLTLPTGVELTDTELEQITGELLPIWIGFAVSLAARAAAAAAVNAGRGTLVGAPSGVLPEVGRQLDLGQFDARALGCAALGGAIAGAIGGPLAPGATTVSGGMGLVVGGLAGSRCGR